MFSHHKSLVSQSGSITSAPGEGISRKYPHIAGYVHKPLHTKRFHGVLAGNAHECLLKLCIGKVRLIHWSSFWGTLYDEAVAELEAEASGRPLHKDVLAIEHFQIPEFVIAGAKTAQTAYKALYPLTENL